MGSGWLHFDVHPAPAESEQVLPHVVHSSSIAKEWRRCDDDGEMKKTKSSVVNTAPGDGLLRFANGRKFGTILCDPPWQFQNRTGKVAPEHKRLSRYGTLKLPDIVALPISRIAMERSHLYLWVPNALLPEGL